MAVVGLGLLAAHASAEGRPETQKDRASYAMGVSVARNIQRQGVDVDANVLAIGLRDALSGQLAMTDEEIRSIMSDVAAETKRKAAARKSDRKAAGEAFRAENSKKEGVVILANGVQYRILEAGDGSKPTATDTVAFHYRGALVDGKVFDSSYRRGKPAKVNVSRTLPAWRGVLTLMPVGSTWQVVFPPELGSPARGKAPKNKAPRDETLVFELKLLSIEPRRAVEARANAGGVEPQRP